jgi:hypothetical protein
MLDLEQNGVDLLFQFNMLKKIQVKIAYSTIFLERTVTHHDILTSNALLAPV